MGRGEFRVRWSEGVGLDMGGVEIWGLGVERGWVSVREVEY